jgi:hypothetical protein
MVWCTLPKSIMVDVQSFAQTNHHMTLILSVLHAVKLPTFHFFAIFSLHLKNESNNN